MDIGCEAKLHAWLEGTFIGPAGENYSTLTFSATRFYGGRA
jgi:hypothetical protein